MFPNLFATYLSDAISDTTHYKPYFLALLLSIDFYLSKTVSESFLLYTSDSFPSYRITVHVSMCLAVTQVSMEMTASLQAPFKSTCHFIINKFLPYMPIKSCSSSSGESDEHGLHTISLSFSLQHEFFITCLSSLEKYRGMDFWLPVSGLILIIFNILCIGSAL